MCVQRCDSAVTASEERVARECEWERLGKRRGEERYVFGPAPSRPGHPFLSTAATSLVPGKFPAPPRPRPGEPMFISIGRAPTRCSMLPICMLVAADSYKPAPSSIDRLIPALQLRDGNMSAITDDLSSLLGLVWEQGWREQLDEIEALSADLDDPASIDDDSTGLDLVSLWRESENATKGHEAAARLTCARHVTSQLMRFWRSATPRNDNLDPRTTEEIVREPMSRDVALAERRRQLRRHARAGLVEYRICDALHRASNPAAFTATPLQDHCSRLSCEQLARCSPEMMVCSRRSRLPGL